MSDRLLTLERLAAFSPEPQASRHWLPRVSLMFRTAITRRELADLDDHILADIGISHADAVAESLRAPWDVANGPSRAPSKRPARGSIWGTVRQMVRRHRSRHQIASLDAHALRDIGVTYAEAEAEANKPFWRG